MKIAALLNGSSGSPNTASHSPQADTRKPSVRSAGQECYAEIDLERALSAGAEALAMVAGLQSGRAVRYVDDLRRRLRRRHGSEPKVRDFDELVSESLGSR